MEITFEEMPATSRVWVYQANRALNDQEAENIKNNTQSFLSQWAAHGAPLKGAVEIFHNRFLVIAADETFNQPSGCSIDSSVHFLQKLSEDLDIGFFDRTQIAFMVDGEVLVEPLANIKRKVEEGVIKNNTLTFNNLVTNKMELEQKWLDRAENTWLKRYF